MNKFKFYTLLFALIAMIACSDDVDPIFIADIETDSFVFESEGGLQTFILESNEKWVLSEFPDWISITVKDVENPNTRSTSYGSGIKEVEIFVKENEEYLSRSAEITLTSLSNEVIKINVEQLKKLKLVGYWILSEGYAGTKNAELGWYDVQTEQLKTKQFEVLNGKKLGDTANELKQYGSKMYCLVSGPGFGDDTPEGEAYIEVINPNTGKSIKRIHFTNSEGVTAKPRNMVFEGGKAYISSYSNEVVRLDTATLTLDAHAKLSGSLAEGIAYNSGHVYVCNSGQGEDNKISVVDIENMKETKVITTAMNPTGIVSVSDGVLYFNTNYPNYELYKLTVDGAKIEKVNDVRAGDIAYLEENVYSCFYDWGTYAGETYKHNIKTQETQELDLDYDNVNIPMIMEYHIGVINRSKDLFISGMGQDVVIVDTKTNKIKHAFKMGVANGTGVVAVYK